MDCLLCKNCCANQEDDVNNEMIINDEEKNDNIANEQYNKKICQICASAIDKYPSILNRISNVELYYLCENFLARDKFNVKHRSNEETVNKLISFAKGECIDVDDIHLLEQINDDDLEKCVKNKRDDIKLLGKGADNAIYSCKKKKFLKSKKNTNMTFALSNGCGYIAIGEVNHGAYTGSKVILTKILLSLFARQTKYYTDFIMKEICNNKQIRKEMPKNTQCRNDTLTAIFENIDKNEQHKEVARQLFFQMYDHFKIYQHGCWGLVFNKKYINPLYRNKCLDNNGKIIDIDLCWAKPVEKKDFDQILGFVRKTQEFDLSKIFSNLKKNLTISPKMIAYHTLMELKKYKFEDFNNEHYTHVYKKSYFSDDIYANTIRASLMLYKNLLCATKENIKDINTDIAKMCEKQLNVYNGYINKVKDYKLDNFRNDFKQEQEQITVKINKYRKMEGTIKGMTKNTPPPPIPLSVCCNDAPKINKKDNNKKKGNLFVVKR